MQCTNNLKQLGLAVHNFHDTRNGLPPSTIGFAKLGIHAFLMPFMEQGANWDRLNRPAIGMMRDRRWWYGGTQGKNAEIPAADELTDADRKGLASIPGFVCPSRRAPGATAPDNGVNAHAEAAGTSTTPGPQTDYAGVIMGSASAAQLAANGNLYAYWWAIDTDQPYATIHRGAFRGALLTKTPEVTHAWIDRYTSVCNGWQVRDAISWWKDGTSNQFVFGEKHIPSSLLGQCGVGNTPSDGDCSYMSTEQYGTVAATRQFNMGTLDPPNTSSGGRFIVGGPFGVWEFPLAKGNEKATPPDQGTIYHQGFGSSHPGTCNFLLGDGSVRGVSVTTPVNPILYCMGLVNDGLAVALP
jgi:prepilin-type processing-associated H-X9-DG protein